MNNPLMNWAIKGERLDYFFINSQSTYEDGELLVELPVIKETLEEIIENSKFSLRAFIQEVLDNENWLNYMLEAINENEIRIPVPNRVITASYIEDNFYNWLDDCPLEWETQRLNFTIYNYEIISNNSNCRTSVERINDFQPTMYDILDYMGDREIKTNRDFWSDMVVDYYDKKVFEKVRNNFSNPKTIKTLIDLKIKPKYDKETISLFDWWLDGDGVENYKFVELSTTLGSI